MMLLKLVLFCVLLATTCGASDMILVNRGHHLKKRDVITSTDKPSLSVEANITSLFITSKIQTRFANTIITSTIENPSATQSREALFTIELPETAFISNFTMLINGTLEVAEVKTKEDAEKAYQEAREKGLTAGKVSSTSPAQRGMDRFSVSVTLSPNSPVTFTLTYQQLLERVPDCSGKGLYKHIINVRPNQLVPVLEIDVLVVESQGFLSWDAVQPCCWNAVTMRPASAQNTTEVSYQFKPSIADQEKSNESLVGISGQIVISYDVNHQKDGGLLLLDQNDPYFIHLFSPIGYDGVFSKNVIFVIDKSGSMSGAKMEQTIKAMLAILDQLNAADRFNILLFSSTNQYWKTTLVEATPQNVEEAKKFVDVRAGGGTMAYAALDSACQKLLSIPATSKSTHMIIFLTDGLPSSKTPKQIRHRVNELAKGKIALYSIGFGNNVNFDFLTAIAISMDGFAQKIYEDTDAQQQLVNFFCKIKSPVLTNLKFRYGGIGENLLDEKSFSGELVTKQYNMNSELIFSGKFNGVTTNTVHVTVEGDSIFGDESLSTTSVVLLNPFMDGQLEKIWVYQRIKKLLNDKLITDDEQKAKEITQEALGLSLRYKLVTPLTSMIIVQKDQRNSHLNDQKISHSLSSGISRGTSFLNKNSSKSPMSSVVVMFYAIFFSIM